MVTMHLVRATTILCLVAPCAAFVAPAAPAQRSATRLGVVDIKRYDAEATSPALAAAAALVGSDLGEVSPALLADDFEFTDRGTGAVFTKRRYGRAKPAVGGLRAASSDFGFAAGEFREFGGRVYFTVTREGTLVEPYGDAEASGPFRSFVAGSAAFDGSGKCTSLEVGAALDRGGALPGAAAKGYTGGGTSEPSSKPEAKGSKRGSRANGEAPKKRK